MHPLGKDRALPRLWNLSGRNRFGSSLLTPEWCILDAAMQQIAVTPVVLLCENWRVSESASHADGESGRE